MRLLNTKTFEELTEESLSKLKNIGFSTDKGSIAKLFLNIVNQNTASLYDTLTINHLRAFLSTSDGDALNAIGELLACTRGENEGDEDYKYRISKQTKVLASSNYTAIYLASLSVSGVKDIFLKPYSQGTGTYSIIVSVQEGYNEQSVIKNVTSAVETTNGYGIKFNVTAPSASYVKLKIKLFLKEKYNTNTIQDIKYDVQLNLAKYLSSLKVGESIVISDITTTIKNTHASILNFSCLEFSIDGEKMMFVDQPCTWFKKFAQSPGIDSIVVE